jgi:hypothetical protein
MVLPTRDEVAVRRTHDPPNLGLHASGFQSGTPVFYALGYRKQSGGNLMQFTSDLKEVLNDPHIDLESLNDRDARSDRLLPADVQRTRPGAVRKPVNLSSKLRAGRMLEQDTVR